MRKGEGEVERGREEEGEEGGGGGEGERERVVTCFSNLTPKDRSGLKGQLHTQKKQQLQTNTNVKPHTTPLHHYTYHF